MSGVLVTGGSGFVGVPFLQELARGDEEVHAISTRPAPVSLAGVRWHQLDLAEGGAVEQLVSEIAPERLVHLAWYVEHGRFWSSPENVLWVERSLRLLRAFIAAGGRRAVMLGTCAEYDWSATDEPLDESSSPLDPATLYGAAKDSLRRLATAYAHGEGVELAWARLFFMYGPREQPDRLVPSVIRSLLRGEPIPTTSGEQVRDFMYIDDVASALVALVESEVVGPVDIASGHGVKVRELLEEIATQLGAPQLVRRGSLPDRPGEPAKLVGRGERLRKEVGYRPRIGLAEGVADTVRWWSGHG